MTRAPIALAALALIALIVGIDLVQARPNPYLAPPMLALGSGQVASGGFCGSLPD